MANTRPFRNDSPGGFYFLFRVQGLGFRVKSLGISSLGFRA